MRRNYRPLVWILLSILFFTAQELVDHRLTSWCRICRAMQGAMAALAQDYPLISLAMQSGDAPAVERYLKAERIRLPVILDEAGTLAGRYGVRGVPAIFVLGPDGDIRYATAGYTSAIGLRTRLWMAGLSRPNGARPGS